MAASAVTGKVPPTIRFGNDFELDMETVRLSHDGRAIHVERIPLELLCLLVERRGAVVSRQEIASRIWGDTFVDTDNSINGAIRKLRHALKDDPDDPRYIETITAKGYRFIAEANETNQAVEPSTSRRVPYSLRLWSALIVTVLLVAATAAFVVNLRRPQRPAAGADARLMLAVLPFENLTGDPNQDYFSDGLTEEMISHLGNLDPKHLGVIARTSVMHFKGNKADLPQLAKDLNVQYVIEGSVRRNAGTVRVTVQLIEMTGYSHVWARQYDRELSNLLVLQDDISKEVAREIEITVVPPADVNQRHRPENLTPPQLAAYDLYLRGRHFWNTRTWHGFNEAAHFFEEAVQQDPANARSYAGLADTYALMSSYGLGKPEALMPKAKAAAQKAVSLDEHLAEAHASLALVALNYDWDWATAEKEYQRAIELDPNYATAYHWYAEFLAEQGRFDQALVNIERARRLDPLSLIMAADHGVILFFARRNDEAIAQFRTVLAADPAFSRANIIAFAYAEQSRFDEALAAARSWQSIEVTPWTYAIEANVYGRTNRPQLAKQSLQKLETTAADLHLDPVPMLIAAHVGMGNKAKALQLLEDCYRRRSHLVVVLKVDPIYDSLRSEPRFKALLARAGLTDTIQAAYYR